MARSPAVTGHLQSSTDRRRRTLQQELITLLLVARTVVARWLDWKRSDVNQTHRRALTFGIDTTIALMMTSRSGITAFSFACPETDILLRRIDSDTAKPPTVN